MDDAGALGPWSQADVRGVTCRLPDVPEVACAASNGRDRNVNARVDTNVVSLPTDAWGVSGFARPTLRAPRFDETVFKVAAQAERVVTYIEVAK